MTSATTSLRTSRNDDAVPLRLASRVAARAYVEGIDMLEDLTVDAFRDAESYRFLALEAVAAYQREYRHRCNLQRQIRKQREEYAELRAELQRYTAARVTEPDK